MSSPTNRWKLGLFVVIGTLVGTAMLIAVGAQSLRKETVTYYSYFDEAVSGLDIGSSVSFRGVRVGNVSSVDVAPDRRHVEVSYDLEEKVLTRLGLAKQVGRKVRVRVPPDLRVQLSTTSITGGKYLKLDFFDPAKNPPPELPFVVAENYIPATPSTLKNLEDSLLRAVEQVPELVAQIKLILARTDGFLGALQDSQLPQRASLLIERTDHMLLTFEAAVRDLNTKELSGEARATLASVNATMMETQTLLQRVHRQDGLLDRMERASTALGDLSSDADGNLFSTLRSLRDMADSVRRLSDALEREPDMLLKGRDTEKSK